jgi:uncharacterized protein (DUF849 family)
VLARGRLDGSVVRILLEIVGDGGPDAPDDARDAPDAAGDGLARAVELLAAARAALPPGVYDEIPFLLHGEDAAAWPVLRLALREGLQTRIGLEDVLTGPDGERVDGNADLVRAARALTASGAGN